MILSNTELQEIESQIPTIETVEKLCELSAKLANAKPVDWMEERRLYLLELDIQKQHKVLSEVEQW